MIIGINKGVVVEMGNHAEMMNNEGLYYQLIMNQKIAEEEKGKGIGIIIFYTYLLVFCLYYSICLDMFWKAVNEQTPVSSAIINPAQYSSTVYREGLRQNTELMDVTEVCSITYY